MEVKLSPEQIAEIERCIADPVYFYNTYWVDKDGNHPKPITQEKWDDYMKISDEFKFRRR